MAGIIVFYMLLVDADPPVVRATVLVVTICTAAVLGRPLASFNMLAAAALVVLALLGELFEFVAGALGAAKAGGTRRAALLSLAGSLAGGIVGVFIGMPIPVIGSLVAAVVFAGAGALVGAMLGEIWAGQTMRQSLRVGHAALWGRIFGTLAKTLLASVMVVVARPSLLITITPFLSMMFSLYVPGETSTVSIAEAASIAAWMVPYGDGTASTSPVPT